MIRSRAFWLGLVFSAAFLGLFFYLFVDLQEVVGFYLAEFSGIFNLEVSKLEMSIVLGWLSFGLALWLRSRRWRFLLTPINNGMFKRKLLPVVIVGYMANNLIPIRIGELVRAYYLNLREDIGTMAGFGTVVVERVSDVIALVLILALATATAAIGVTSALADATPVGIFELLFFLFAPLITVVVLVVMMPSTIRSLLDSVSSFFPQPLRRRIRGLSEDLIEGLTVVKSVVALLRVIFWSLLVWIAELAMYFFIALGIDMQSSFDNQLEFVAAIVVFGTAANLAGIFPSSAGSWGPFDFFGTLALTALGVDNQIAAEYALMVHFLLWVPPIVGGFVILVFDHTSMANLLQGARSAKSPVYDASASTDVDVESGVR